MATPQPNEHLTYKFLLRYYLFKTIIAQSIEISTCFCYNNHKNMPILFFCIVFHFFHILYRRTPGCFSGSPGISRPFYRIQIWRVYNGKKDQTTTRILIPIIFPMKIYLDTNACTECTGLMQGPASGKEEWDMYREIFDFTAKPPRPPPGG